MLLFSMVAFAGDRDVICYDCLTDYPLYRVAGLGDPHPDWSVDFDEAISVTILFGVIEGGGGAVLPHGGGGPIPIDPEWLVHVATYTDARDLEGQIERLTVSLDRHRLDWTAMSDVAETTRLRGEVAVVTPRSEADAIAWIAENSRSLVGLDHPTVVFVQEGGAALEEIGLLR